VYNVHSMTHLAAEAKQFGSLDSCSGFFIWELPAACEETGEIW
jgi:hypothetical protein